MEKYGVRNEILYEDLRREEAILMQQLQESLTHGTKVATDRSLIESRLSGVRSKLSELDLGKNMVEDFKE